MELPLYQYSPLHYERSIRIIRLHEATNPNDDLQCTIIMCTRGWQLLGNPEESRSQTQSYEAVSYTWGKQEFIKHLICNEGSGKSRVQITENIDFMLRHLRRRQKPRNIWIDVISLNQKDETEKEQQVPLMGKIYNDAKNVVVWLNSPGLSSAGARNVFRKLEELASASEGNSNLININDDVTSLIQYLSKYRWFYRRWVLQEVVRGKMVIVQLGKDTCDWRVFSTGILAAEKLVTMSDRLHYGIFRTVRMIESQIDNWLELLWNLDHTECSNLHDMLFALYGLTDTARNLEKPQPNYRCHWQQTYETYTRYFIAQGQWPEVLRHCSTFGTLYDTPEKGPSWVPNWSNRRKCDLRSWPQKLERDIEFQINPSSLLVISIPSSQNGENILTMSSGCWSIVTDHFKYSSRNWKKALKWLKYFSESETSSSENTEELFEKTLKNAALLFKSQREDGQKLSNPEREKIYEKYIAQGLERMIPKHGYLYLSEDECGEVETLRRRLGYCSQALRDGDMEFSSEGLSCLIRPVLRRKREVSISRAYLVGSCYTKYAWNRSINLADQINTPRVRTYELI